MAADGTVILVVDDNPDTNEALVRLLRLRGHHAVSAFDGQDALVYLRDGNRPALIVLDVRMPIVDGRAFRDVQLADPELARIPVVVYSAVDAPDALGAVPYVRKGTDPDRVIDVIEQVCPRVDPNAPRDRAAASRTVLL